MFLVGTGIMLWPAGFGVVDVIEYEFKSNYKGVEDGAGLFLHAGEEVAYQPLFSLLHQCFGIVPKFVEILKKA